MSLNPGFSPEQLWSQTSWALLLAPLLTSRVTPSKFLGLSDPQGSSTEFLLSSWCLFPGPDPSRMSHAQPPPSPPD